MTFSILTYDEKTGTMGAAAATGSLCVGGWVLRGSIDGGLVASQGTAPSTFWRDEALQLMSMGRSAQDAVQHVTAPDTGRDFRQIAALDLNGDTAAHTGMDSIAFADHFAGQALVVAGNMLAGPEVLDALRGAYQDATGDMAHRLMRALNAAQATGGDYRGLQSAAMLVLRHDAPPLDLRIDFDDNPLNALQALIDRAHAQPYAGWLDEVPVARDRHRAPSRSDAAE